jgi:hypothetical protein
MASTVSRALGLLFLGLVALTGFHVHGGAESLTSPGEGLPRFSEHLIKDKYTYSYGIQAADLDGDGDLDLTSADCSGNHCLYWFENDGRGRFRQHFIEKHYPTRLERHGIGDINRDGKPDVVIVENLKGDVLWYQNSGKPAQDPHWQRFVLCKEKIPGAYDVALADLDGDGDLDVAASSWRLSNNFVWFENPGKPEAAKEWPMHVIEDKVSETRMIRAGDLNGDGKIDLVGTGSGAALVVWYENPGDPRTQAWKKQVIDAGSKRPVHGQPVDLDKDGDLDVVLAVGMGGDEAGAVVWYENLGKPGKGREWKRHTIGQPLAQAIEAAAGDLDGDGDLDVVATAWGAEGQLVWFENPGEPRGPWRRHALKPKWQRANQVILADLNGDRRLDIVAGAERSANEVRWWRNEGR